MKKIIMLMAVVGLIAIASGCKQEPLLAFEGQDGVSFKLLSIYNHSFYGMSATELPSETVRVPIHILGFTRPYDRTVTGAAVEDNFTTATPSDYRIIGGTIPAGSLDGWFYMELINNDQLATDALSLRVAITENEFFAPGLKENYTYRFVWTQQILQPAMWNGMRFFFCSVYSTQCYKAIIESTGRKKFWYYEAGPDWETDPEDVKLEAASMYSYGIMFANHIRKYNAEHPGAPMLHDDGTGAGTEIIPLY